MRKIIALILFMSAILTGCGNKSEDTDEIKLSSSNIQNYVEIKTEYVDFKIDKIDTLVGDSYRYTYVCTVRHRVIPRGDYEYNECYVTLDIYSSDVLLVGNDQWRSSDNVSGGVDGLLIYRREKIHLDAQGFGEVETVWQMTSTNPDVQHPKYAKWNWHIGGSGTIKPD